MSDIEFLELFYQAVLSLKERIDVMVGRYDGAMIALGCSNKTKEA
jgi:hypothetical protein